MTLVIAAHDEEGVIERSVANALEPDYPRDLLQVVVASDGSSDRTVELAHEAGADLILDLDRAGKVAAQNAAVEQASGEILAFSDANSFWDPSALRALVAALTGGDVGYVCGQVSFEDAAGTNEEGAYWRYEMAVRSLESELDGITAGNGAIYAVRREGYVVAAPTSGHDLCLPSQLSKNGLRAVYEPNAVASELMAPAKQASTRESVG